MNKIIISALAAAAAGTLLTACTGQSKTPPASSTPVLASPLSTPSASTVPATQTLTASPNPTVAGSTVTVMTAAPAPAQSSAAQPDTSARLTQEFCIRKEGLCFNHPEGWRFAVEDAHTYGGDDVLLYNPAGKLVYYLATGVTQIGGACGDEPHPHEVLSVNPTRLAGYGADRPAFNADSASVITMVSQEAKGWRTEVALSTLKTVLTVGASDSCDFFSNVIKGRMAVGDGSVTPPNWPSHLAFGHNMYLSKKVSADVDQVLPSKEQAIAALRDNADLPTIVAVLSSAHYK